MFMAVGVLSQLFGKDEKHSFKHDLESFFWVLLFVVAGHVEPPQLRPNAVAEETLATMRPIDRLTLAGLKMLTMDGIDTPDLVERFGTSWARDLGPLVREFAQCVKDFKHVGESDPDSCFEDVISIFLKTAIKLRPTPGDG